MNDKLKPRSPFIDNFIHFTYKPLVLIVLVFMLYTTFMAGFIIYFSFFGLKEPSWFLNYHALLKLLNIILNPVNTDAFRAFSSLAVALAALFMVYFLKRCVTSNHMFEFVYVFILLLLGVLQLILIIIMPSLENADLNMINGRDVITHMNLLLTKTSNIALVVFSASMGIQLSNNKRKPDHE